MICNPTLKANVLVLPRLFYRYRDLAPQLVPLDYTNHPDVKLPYELIGSMPELKVDPLVRKKTHRPTLPFYSPSIINDQLIDRIHWKVICYPTPLNLKNAAGSLRAHLLEISQLYAPLRRGKQCKHIFTANWQALRKGGTWTTLRLNFGPDKDLSNSLKNLKQSISQKSFTLKLVASGASSINVKFSFCLSVPTFTQKSNHSPRKRHSVKNCNYLRKIWETVVNIKISICSIFVFKAAVFNIYKDIIWSCLLYLLKESELGLEGGLRLGLGSGLEVGLGLGLESWFFFIGYLS